MNKSIRLATWITILSLTAGIGLAQYRGFNRRVSANDGLPDWDVDQEFSKDLFTFVRVQYDSGGGWGGGGGWTTDWPDSDANLSFRLQQMTSMKVLPKGKILQLTDKALFDHPWIYIVEPGSLSFSDEEAKTLRRYLLNGGFLMVDDFWGEAEWHNFYREIKRVFPDREPIELPMDHPIFHCVFDLKLSKNGLQTPSIDVWLGSGVTWERWDAKEVHIRGIFDDKGRMMVIVCHNTDNGDGWEREGESEDYFRTFSEKICYPLGINIVYYAMTH